MPRPLNAPPPAGELPEPPPQDRWGRRPAAAHHCQGGRGDFCGGCGHPGSAPVPKLVPHALRRWVGGWVKLLVGGSVWLSSFADPCHDFKVRSAGWATAHPGPAGHMHPPTPVQLAHPSLPSLACPPVPSRCALHCCLLQRLWAQCTQPLTCGAAGRLLACTLAKPTFPASPRGWARTAAAASSGGCWGSCTRACCPAGASSATGGPACCACMGERVRVWRLVFVLNTAVCRPASRQGAQQQGGQSENILQPATIDHLAAPACLGLPAAGPGCACPTCQCCATPSPALCSPRWVSLIFHALHCAAWLLTE
jgi:hypothetical protein